MNGVLKTLYIGILKYNWVIDDCKGLGEEYIITVCGRNDEYEHLALKCTGPIGLNTIEIKLAPQKKY